MLRPKLTNIEGGKRPVEVSSSSGQLQYTPSTATDNSSSHNEWSCLYTAPEYSPCLRKVVEVCFILFIPKPLLPPPPIVATNYR